MAIRLPLQTVLDYDDAGNVGASSVNGGVAKTFMIPQDTDNIVVKMTASIGGGAVSTILQTTDDGGSTWYDVARTSITSVNNNQNAQWLSVPVISQGLRTSVVKSASVLTTTIGTAAASTVSGQNVTGLPILSQINRIFLVYTGDVVVGGNSLSRVQVKVNSQSATA
jgi:hypothetical protein